MVEEAPENVRFRLPPELVAVSKTPEPMHIAEGVGTVTVGDGVTVIVTVELIAGQAPGGSFVVRVNVTVPLDIEGV